MDQCYAFYMSSNVHRMSTTMETTGTIKGKNSRPINSRVLNDNYAARGPIIKKVRGLSNELKNVSSCVI